VLDFAVVDITARLGHLKPPHVANRLARARQRIVDRLLHSVRRRADDLNFLINVFSHTPIVCRASDENNKNPRRPGKPDAPVAQRGICFTNQHSFRQSRVVRTSFAVSILLTAAFCCARAQDQEKKLLDRLLKPDMALQNDAQNKKFVGDGSVSINKRASVGAFYVHQKTRSKGYSGTRDFSTTQFYSQTYRGGRTAHEVSSQQTLANSKAIYANQTARGVRDASQSGKKVDSRAYTGNRPFLDQGTNQKSLNRQNEPLTIEQVRELLNKNK
jgi:hypothetical protein